MNVTVGDKDLVKFTSAYVKCMCGLNSSSDIVCLKALLRI